LTYRGGLATLLLTQQMIHSPYSRSKVDGNPLNQWRVYSK